MYVISARCVAHDLHTARLCPGHLSVHVGDSSWYSEEIIKILNCAFKCNYYYYYYTFPQKSELLCLQEERTTRTVARTFSPEFSHHVEFPLQLLWSGSQDDPGCLAQMLESGQVQFEVWHQVPTGGPGQLIVAIQEKDRWLLEWSLETDYFSTTLVIHECMLFFVHEASWKTECSYQKS